MRLCLFSHDWKRDKLVVAGLGCAVHRTSKSQATILHLATYLRQHKGNLALAECVNDCHVSKSFHDSTFMDTTLPSAAPAAFTYTPLPSTGQHIRLLRIHKNEQGVHCRLAQFELTNTLEYKALSYMWGPKTPQYPILLNGNTLMIRQNLYDFFRFAAIEEVIVWLGKEDDDSDVAVSMVADFNGSSRSALASTNETQDSLKPLSMLFSRPYWSGLWILQEIILAQQLLVCCGTMVYSWSQLENMMKDDRNLVFLATDATIPCQETHDIVYSVLGLLKDPHCVEVYYASEKEIFS